MVVPRAREPCARAFGKTAARNPHKAKTAYDVVDGLQHDMWRQAYSLPESNTALNQDNSKSK